jgi:hypothetical protein
MNFYERVDIFQEKCYNKMVSYDPLKAVFEVAFESHLTLFDRSKHIPESVGAAYDEIFDAQQIPPLAADRTSGAGFFGDPARRL